MKLRLIFYKYLNGTKKLNIAYRSKYNLTYDKQIIVLMITDGEKWHYLVVKNLSG